MGATIDSIEEETTSPASAAVTETTTVAVVKTRTGNDIGGSIDLLAALQLHNTTRQGVTQVPGLVRLKPAYYLQGEYPKTNFIYLFFLQLLFRFLFCLYLAGHHCNFYDPENTDPKTLRYLRPNNHCLELLKPYIHATHFVEYKIVWRFCLIISNSAQ